MALVWSKEVFDNQTNIECGFTLKRVQEMTRTYSQMNRTDKFWLFSSIVYQVWPNSWMIVYELGGSRFESRCTHLNIRCCASFKKAVPWYIKCRFTLKNVCDITRTYNQMHCANIDCGFSLKRVHDMTRKYSPKQSRDKNSQFSSVIWLIWPNGCVFVSELSGCGFESSCSDLISDKALISRKEFLDIHSYIECGFTLKNVHDMTRTYS